MGSEVEESAGDKVDKLEGEGTAMLAGRGGSGSGGVEDVLASSWVVSAVDVSVEADEVVGRDDDKAVAELSSSPQAFSTPSLSMPSTSAAEAVG